MGQKLLFKFNFNFTFKAKSEGSYKQRLYFINKKILYLFTM